MRNRAFLPLIEILLTIAVFAIAAAICLQGFGRANDISKKRSELDAAVLFAQDTCEVLKHSRGDLSLAAELTGGTVTDDGIVIHRRADGDEAELTATVTVTEDGIGRATVSISTPERTVYELAAAWQP